MELFFCVVLPLLLLTLGAVAWFTRQRPGPNQAEAPDWSDDAFRDTLARLLGNWVSQGRLPRESAAQVLALLREDRAQAAQLIPAPPAPAAPAIAATPAPAIAATPAPAIAATPAPASMAMAMPAQPAAGAAILPPQRSWIEQLGTNLLALRTRQTLLFLGAFLLVVSALILVVFNWASFPPILQFALLAAVCGGLWGGGQWISSRWGLTGAGAGLRAIGAVLTPVVIFSLSRPGLLELMPRGGWLLASALSLPIYALAAWRLRHVVYVVAGCLAAASAVLAALSFVDSRWLPAALIVTLAAMLALAQHLKRSMPDLAAGPAWVTRIGAPLALLWAMLWLTIGQIDQGVLAATLFIAVGFYLLAAWLERWPIWAWVAATLAPLGLLAGLSALEASPIWWALAPGILALLYLGLAAQLEPSPAGIPPAYSLPAYAGSAGLALLSLLMVQSWATARWALPVLIAIGAGATLAIHRGRLGRLGEPFRLAIATLGLVFAVGLLPAWLLALLDLTPLNDGERGLALLPLAALLFAAARWWPGRLRRQYDIALQSLGALIALGAGAATLFDHPTAAIGMAALTAVWAWQTILRRRSLWAALALGSALPAAALELDRLAIGTQPAYWFALGLLFAGGYALAGTLLRRSAWRCLTWPGLGWGALLGIATLLAVLFEAADGVVLVRHVVVVAALAGLLALTAAFWRQAWPGYLVAALLALDVLLAAERGFFLGWDPARTDFGYVLCGLTLGLALLGQGLRWALADRRRIDDNEQAVRPSSFVLRQGYTRYAYPYEVVGFALLTAAPLPAAADAQHACLVWAMMALLYALAAWRYRLPWAVAPALIAADMALLRGADWLGPGGQQAGAGLLLLIAAWAQAAIGLWAHRRERASAALTPWQRHSTPAYLVAVLSGMAALALASGASSKLAIVALGLAEQREELAWGALTLLALGLAALHAWLGVAPLWSLAWGMAEALAVCLLGWAIEWKIDNETLKMQQPGAFSIWVHPLWLGPLLAGSALAGLLLVMAVASEDLPPLTFGLATFALLLATLAVRRRAPAYAYAAGAALIAAGLCQLYDWEFRQPQWYVIPAGLYLLALAAGLRRFQGQRGLAQVLESGAAVLMLGTTLGQSLQTSGLVSQGYAAWLCAESLLVLGYGALRQLRAPFFGGAGFFVLGVSWLSLDPLLATNKWVLLGILGLLLVGAYVLLERRQEQLARAGRALVERISAWN
jgi:hypothetical protein